jgi:hypothetical protein
MFGVCDPTVFAVDMSGVVSLGFGDVGPALLLCCLVALLVYWFAALYRF